MVIGELGFEPYISSINSTFESKLVIMAKANF
jgi:hypothetical protein